MIGIWPPLPPKLYARRPSKKLPFPLEEPNCRIFSLARQGLFVGVKALGLEPGDEILVPAYHHGSEVEALVRAGIVCRFYDIGPDLEPDEKDLEALLGPRVRAFYLIHFLGLPQGAARWRTWCDEHGLLLIEDAAQAWLSSRGGTPVGSHGDLSIFCLYKTFALPDGAAVISNSPAGPPRSRGHAQIKRCVERHGSYLSRRSRRANELRQRLKGYGGRTAVLDGQSPVHDGHGPVPGDFVLGAPGAPCPTTRFLLPRVTDPTAQAKRAANYNFLLERLGRFVPDCFAHLPEGASPFAFPIQSDQKTELIDRLDRHGIGVANFWGEEHPSCPAADFPRVAALRKSIIGLPVHQELGVRELERIVDAVLGGTGSAPAGVDARLVTRSKRSGRRSNC